MSFRTIRKFQSQPKRQRDRNCEHAERHQEDYFTHQRSRATIWPFGLIPWTAPCTASIAPRFLREMGSRMRSRILKYFRYVGVSAERYSAAGFAEGVGF
jgi:hypothetical protein